MESGRRDVLTPAEILARMPADFAAQVEAILSSPAGRARRDQYDAAQASVVHRIEASHADGLTQLRVTVRDPYRLSSWVGAVLHQAEMRGVVKCPHVFRSPRPGLLDAGLAVATCDECKDAYVARAKRAYRPDELCEVCGKQTSAFFSVIVPHAGMVIHAEQCRTCHDFFLSCFADAEMSEEDR